MTEARHGARQGSRAPLGELTLMGHFTSLPTGKAALMLSMCGLAFRYQDVALFEGEQKRPGFDRLNPARQVPILLHGRRRIRQSAVILLYLAQQTGRFLGRGAAEQRRVLEWMFFDADMVASIRVPRTLTRIFDGGRPDVVAYHRERGLRAASLLDEALGRHAFLAGARPTIADIAVFPVVDNAAEAGLDLGAFGNLGAWMARLRALPGCANHYDLLARYTEVDMNQTPAARAARDRLGEAEHDRALHLGHVERAQDHDRARGAVAALPDRPGEHHEG